MAATELYEAMSTLRAVRRLRPDPIPNDVLRRVLQAATWAPTGGNRQAWRVIVVKDPTRKQRLGELYKKVATPLVMFQISSFPVHWLRMIKMRGGSQWSLSRYSAPTVKART